MTTFLVLGGAGIVLVVLALVLGDVLDGALHLDALDNDLFSVSSIAAFVGSFGFGGAIGLAVSDSTAIAVVVGLVVGALAALGAVKLTRALRRDDSASFRVDTLVGHPAYVITAIPADGYGEVRLNVGGHVRKYAARCAQPVAEGSEVWVSAVVSPTAVAVTPVKREDDPVLPPPIP
ncbi:hypothetical protein G7070_11410 [Propioniciclava coleopterorum]|uniref:NfeD-like C-terminal, partner-binding n=1 Tax=Propioniciclava coleopterorum TaxID=2714937 RepID=A0A6G7Y7Z1_9ACTN|nr:hypothetical protein [Propioniciclava coleopterorum]QIK72768.1 hypothetical protein G7070_11410 [Propioniciclava coleopterorum]